MYEKLSCDDVKDHLMEFVEGTLAETDPELEASLIDHLEECDGCANFAAKVRRGHELVLAAVGPQLDAETDPEPAPQPEDPIRESKPSAMIEPKLNTHQATFSGIEDLELPRLQQPF